MDKELVETLEELRKLLLATSERLNKSGVERTAGLCRALGEDCTYYRKSLSKFVDEDYEEIRQLIKKSAGIFQILEGPGNDR